MLAETAGGFGASLQSIYKIDCGHFASITRPVNVVISHSMPHLPLQGIACGFMTDASFQGVAL